MGFQANYTPMADIGPVCLLGLEERGFWVCRQKCITEYTFLAIKELEPLPCFTHPCRINRYLEEPEKI